MKTKLISEEQVKFINECAEKHKVSLVILDRESWRVEAVGVNADEFHSEVYDYLRQPTSFR